MKFKITGISIGTDNNMGGATLTEVSKKNGLSWFSVQANRELANSFFAGLQEGDVVQLEIKKLIDSKELGKLAKAGTLVRAGEKPERYRLPGKLKVEVSEI